jgi:hypothetical protein
MGDVSANWGFVALAALAMMGCGVDTQEGDEPAASSADQALRINATYKICNLPGGWGGHVWLRGSPGNGGLTGYEHTGQWVTTDFSAYSGGNWFWWVHDNYGHAGYIRQEYLCRL